jgi:Trk K+ transport system NAD-binding subunit
MIRPTVVTFLDVMLRDNDRLRVEESRVMAGSKLDGGTVADLRRLHPADALLIALRNTDGSWTYNPADASRIEPGLTLIYMGSPGAREELEKLCRP